jgi:hypothetical protein
MVQEGVEAEAELDDSIEVEEMEGQSGPGVGGWIWLVVWNMAFIFPIILETIIPTD